MSIIINQFSTLLVVPMRETKGFTMELMGVIAIAVQIIISIVFLKNPSSNIDKTAWYPTDKAACTYCNQLEKK